ncbi:MFS transporter [Georgenia halophila]|uniref:MFS transporter n=1 Tax=Georgenia halophila TaxID=620889 RepID=A0ABP8KTW9_9MICO
MAGRTGTGVPQHGPVLLATVFLITTSLRPAITTVGPVLPQVGADLRLGEAALGALGALPLLAFAASAPLVHHAVRRAGPERAVLLALLALAAALVVRSYTGTAGLWFGTAVIGCAIAVGNVVVPTLIKRDYPRRVARATSVYSACIAGSAAVASAVAVPISQVAGWRGALAIWAVPTILVAAIWSLRAKEEQNPHPDAQLLPTTRRITVWRQPDAWLVTAFMGLQSTCFYVVVTWLPTIEVASGVGPAVAGLHLFAYQMAGILAGLAIPNLLHRTADERVAAVGASGMLLVGLSGILLMPSAMLPWVLVAGVGSGSSLVMALSLISLRGRDPDETTRLSGMAQSLGYLLAAGGPIAAGVLAERTGGWQAPMVMLVALAAALVLVAVPAGRDRRSADG